MSGLLYQEEIKTVLVDDEEMAIHRLKKALSAYPQLKIVAEVKDGKSAISYINAERPDLVFLDIQMPEFNGFEVLSQLTHIPIIVFVTAYEEYAVKAFEKNSLDYLLKPVEADRLAITIKRIMKSRVTDEDVFLKIKKLLHDNQTEPKISTIPVKLGNKINFIQVSEICFFEAKDKYVFIHTRDEEKLIEYSLLYLQDHLPAEFIRIHRSFIINKLKIKEVQKHFKGTYVLIMDDTISSRIKSAISYHSTIRTKLLLP